MNFFDIAYRKVIGEIDTCVVYILPGLKIPALVGFIIGIAAFFFIWRIIRNQNYKFFGKIVKFQLFLIPIILTVGVGAYSLINETEDYYQKKISENIIPISRMGFPIFQHFVNNEDVMKDSMSFTYSVTVKSFANAFRKTPEGNIETQLKMLTANHFTPIFAKWSIDAILKQAVIELHLDGIGQLDQIRSIQILALSSNSWKAIKSELNTKITKQFSDYRKKVLIGFGLVFALIISQCYSLLRLSKQS